MNIRVADSADLDLIVELRIAFLCEVREVDPADIPDHFRAATR